MKIGMPVKNDNGMDALINEQFGRAPMFAIYDTENSNIEFIDNSASASAAHGAGINTAQMLISKGIDVAVGAHIGPKSAEILSSANIRLCEKEFKTVREAIEGCK